MGKARRPGMMGKNILSELENEYLSNKSRFENEDELIQQPTVPTKEEALEKIVLDEKIAEQLSKKQIYDIPIEKLYSAPSDWNQWASIGEEKMFETAESIIKVGQLTPCIVWKIDKEDVKHFYQNIDGEIEDDKYDFTGHEYMIISGHNRTYITRLLSEIDSFKDTEMFTTVPCIIYTDELTDDFQKIAKQIIDDSNWLSRNPSPKEIMGVIKRKYAQMSSNDGLRRRKNSIAQEIAKTLNLNDRTIYRYTKLNDDLIEPILDLMYNQKISLNDALTLSDLDKNIQYELYNNYADILVNKKKLKSLIKKVDINKSTVWDEIEKNIVEPEYSIPMEKITVRVPKNKIDELYDLVRQWKESEIANSTDTGQLN